VRSEAKSQNPSFETCSNLTKKSAAISGIGGFCCFDREKPIYAGLLDKEAGFDYNRAVRKDLQRYQLRWQA